MHTRLVVLGNVLLWLALWAVCLPVFGQARSGPERCARDYVLIKFRPELCQEALKLPIAKGLDWLIARLSLPAGSQLMEPQINHWLRDNLPRLNASPLPSGLLLDRFLYLDLPPGLNLAECLDRLRSNPLVDYAEPDGSGSLCLIPGDSGFYEQWQHYIPGYLSTPPKSGPLNTPEAWDITTGSSNVTVAIIDSGVDSSHLDLVGRLVRGYNVVSNSFDTPDESRLHGTAIALVLGANANNFVNPNEGYAYRTAGVDWQCRMMPIKVVDSSEKTRESWAAQGIDFAVTNGCKVILFSAALTNAESATLSRSISNAIAKGSIFICPSGNSSRPINTYPARYEPAIAVGATGYARIPAYKRASFSQYGPELDVVAPGEYVDGGLSGTSYSAALVAGVCSLMVAVHPDLTHDQARVLLALGAVDLGTPGFDIDHGWGHANAYQSVLLAATRITQAQRLARNQWELSWASPTNDYIKQPYLVQFTPSLSGPWLELTNGSFRYERTLVYTNGGFSHQTNRTYWRGEVPVSSSTSQSSYFRVGIRLKE